MESGRCDGNISVNFPVRDLDGAGLSGFVLNNADDFKAVAADAYDLTNGVFSGQNLSGVMGPESVWCYGR